MRHIPYVEPGQMRIAIRAAKGTGYYPNDLIMNAMSGGMIDLELPDGTVIASRRPFLEEIMFQGAILEQDTVQTLPASTFTILTFPLPVIDTAGFWNPASPTLLTIPAGIEMVEISAGWRSNNITLNGTQALRIESGAGNRLRTANNVNGWPGMSGTTGPIIVSEGEAFEVHVFVAAANATQGNRQTFFKLNVLQVP